jgi:Tol biopolymer transport system component
MSRPVAATEFERVVQSWLAADAPPIAPAQLDAAVLRSVRGARQRPGWVAGLRIDQGWQPRRFQTPSGRRSLQFAVMLLVLALAAVLVASAGRPVPRPAPLSGLARNGLLAYDSNGQIVTSNADGSDRMVLTSGGSQFRSTPIWSPDGLRLAFWSRPAAGGPLTLTVVDADGGRSRLVSGSSSFAVPSLTTRNALWPAPPDWSPDGTRLAFSATVDGASRIVVASLDGAAPRLVGSPTLAALWPVWSPDGQRIAFAGGRYPDAALYVMNADGTNAHALTTTHGTAGSFVAARWSPDGRRLAYHAGDLSLSHAIWLVDADGTNETSPDYGPDGTWLDDLWPTWSPDGRLIAFVRTINQVVDASLGCGAGRPACSPATFVTQPQIFVMNADGSNLHGLGQTGIDDGPPQWSPDGTRIVTTTAYPNPAGFVLIDPLGIAPSTYLPAPASASAWASWERLAP